MGEKKLTSQITSCIHLSMPPQSPCLVGLHPSPALAPLSLCLRWGKNLGEQKCGRWLGQGAGQNTSFCGCIPFPFHVSSALFPSTTSIVSWAWFLVGLPSNGSLTRKVLNGPQTEVSYPMDPKLSTLPQWTQPGVLCPSGPPDPLRTIGSL